jgi:SAM-dependent methyltransferase
MTTAISRADALAERLFRATLGALELFSVYLGAELGLYLVLAHDGPQSADGLARAAGIAPRYAREWLEQQAVAGLLEVADPDAAADARRYALDAEHARVLAAPDDAAHAAPFAHMLAGIGQVLPRVVDAYRTGGGVPYHAYGSDFRHGQGHINRPTFTHELPTAWLAAMPDVVTRLRAGGARVADVGCGQGWSTIALAHAFPAAHIDGLDLDDASIAEARRHAADAGARVRFLAGDATELPQHGPYHLVAILEALHDMAHPVDALAAARTALAPDGAVLVADERVADTFTAPGDEVERMMYGWSVTHCLPTQLAEHPSAALGTVLRSGTVRDLAQEAGFARVEVLPVEFFRLYRLHP